MDIMAAFSAYGNVEAVRAQDGDVFGEVIERNGYRLSEEDVKGTAVIDLGANIGCFSLACAGFGSPCVLAVEPHPDNYERLISNIKRCVPVVPMPYAASGECGKRVKIAGSGTSASIAEDGKHEVYTKDLGWFIDILGPHGKRDLVLKSDCEGAEYDLLFSASRDEIRKFKTIFAEIHKHTDEPKDELVRYIKFFGFTMTWSQPFCTWEWGPNGEMLNFRVLPGTESFRFDRR